MENKNVNLTQLDEVSATNAAKAVEYILTSHGANKDILEFKVDGIDMDSGTIFLTPLNPYTTMLFDDEFANLAVTESECVNKHR